MTTTTVSTIDQWYDKTWLVIVLCLFIFPIGLYALWKSQKFTKGWKIIGTLIIGFVLITTFSDKSQPNEKNKSADALKEQQKTASTEDKPTTSEELHKNEGSLFATTDDFKNVFNEFTSSNDFNLQIDDLDVQEGEVQNVFQYMFNENLGILGTVNKSDESVKEVTMIGRGNGTFKSGGNIFLCMAAIIGAVDPSLKPEERGEILKDLGLLNKNTDFTKMSNKTERNGIKYFVTSSDLMGLMFGASRK